MISCELMGRLGNQMFIAAAAHSLALDNNDEAVFPTMLSGIVPTDRERMIHRKTILSNLKYVDNLSFVIVQPPILPSLACTEPDVNNPSAEADKNVVDPRFTDKAVPVISI